MTHSKLSIKLYSFLLFLFSTGSPMVGSGLNLNIGNVLKDEMKKSFLDDEVKKFMKELFAGLGTGIADNLKKIITEDNGALSGGLSKIINEALIKGISGLGEKTGQEASKAMKGFTKGLKDNNTSNELGGIIRGVFKKGINDIGKDLGEETKKVMKGFTEGFKDNTGDLLREVTDVRVQVFKEIAESNKQIEEELSSFNDKGVKELKKAANQLTGIGEKFMDEVEKNSIKFLKNMLAWGLGVGLFWIGLFIGLSIISPMLIYKITIYYVIGSPPSLASELSSYWHFFFRSKLSIKQIIDQIKKSVILNPEEIEEITLYLKSLEVALMHKLPLPSLVFVGPPGTGKTKIVRIIAKYFARYIFLSGSSFAKFDDGKGITEMDRMFSWGKKKLRNFYTTSCIFIDEIEAFLSKRAGQNAKDRKLFTHFLSYTGLPIKDILLIGATNVPKDIDPAAVRRFTKWIEIKVPNTANKARILKMYLNKILVQRKFTVKADISDAVLLGLAEKMIGATGADIELIVKEVNTRAIIAKMLTIEMIEKSIMSYMKKKKDTQKNYVAEKPQAAPAA